MNQQLARATAIVRRADAAVARAFGPGSTPDTWFSAVAQRRRQWLRATGAWLSARLPTPALDATARGRALAGRGLEFAATERSGLTAAALVAVCGVLLARLLWTPLSWPASAINTFIAPITPSTCNFVGPEHVISDIACGMVLAVLTVSGALLAAGLLLLFRIPLRRLTVATLGAVTGPGTFLVMPLAAVVMFTVGWAGVQYHFPARPGIVADGDFPAVIGLVTFAFARYGPLLRERAAGAFAWGASRTMPMRLGIVMAVPFVVFTLTIPVLSTPVRDQVSVLASMLVAYVLFAPAPTRPPETTP